MNSTQALLVSLCISASALVSVGVFNFVVDPMCYYHCDTVDTSKKTANLYYQTAQKVLAHPDTELIVLGSSRGQSTSPQWLEKRTGLKTLNLSMGAEEVVSKIAFLKFSLKHTHLKRVIIFTDYFDFIPASQDVKIKRTPALRAYLDKDLSEVTLLSKLVGLLEVIDHNTFEAALFVASGKLGTPALDQGSGSDINFEKCQSTEYAGEHSALSLAKESGQTYDSYTRNVLKPKQSAREWDLFVNEMKALDARGVDVLVVIPPYLPQFDQRLKKEFPAIYANHLKWIQDLQALTFSHLRVANYFGGIPGDDGTNRYWNDGVHFTCLGAMAMLDGEL